MKLEGWDEEFMSTINYINEQDQSILFDIIIAANYLHIQWLINITTMEVARKMEKKTSEQIRELFKLENDLEINDDETKDNDTMEPNEWKENMFSSPSVIKPRTRYLKTRTKHSVNSISNLHLYNHQWVSIWLLV